MKMKKVLTLVAAAGIIASASTSFALLIGGKHDMSAGGGATLVGKVSGTSTQVCVYCHAPHNAKKELPLWNRNASVTAASAFKLYSNSGMANKMYSTGFTTDSPSLFCMSCHDGATNVNNVVNAPGDGTLTSGVAGGDGNFGTDLSQSNLTNGHVTHPINFPVTANTTGDLWIGSGAFMGTDATTADATTYGTKNGYQLYDTSRTAGTAARSLECSSCHSVHNYDNSPFLRYTMTRSALCLGCHNK